MNTCKLLVQRYIRNKEIVSSRLTDDSLKPVIENIIGRKDSVNQTQREPFAVIGENIDWTQKVTHEAAITVLLN